MVILGGGAIPYGRGTPVQGLLDFKDTHRSEQDPMLLSMELP
jgi:hypothetical protein